MGVRCGQWDLQCPLAGGGGVENRGGRTNKEEFFNQIANGAIPGVAGKDYPVNSVQALSGRFNGIQVAPADLITPDYPGSSSGNRGQTIFSFLPLKHILYEFNQKFCKN